MSRLIDHVRYVAGVVGTTRGGAATGIGSKLQDMVIAEINHAIRKIYGWREWTKFGIRDHIGIIWPSYSTGTITMTQGSPIVTGSGTAFTKAYQHGLLEVAPTGGSAIRVRTRTVDSATQITLMGPWGFSTEAGLDYALYADTQPLPFDAQNVEDRSVNLHDLAEPLSRIDRRDLDLLHGSTTSFASGEPQRYIDDEVTDVPLWQTANDSGAGTVAVTAAGATLTGTGTSWDDALLQVYSAGDVLIGWPVQVLTTGRSAMNGVLSVASGTSLTLRQGFRGATATGLNYTFGPEGTPVIQFWPPPTDATSWSCRVRQRHVNLYNDDDCCLIPPQWDHVVDELASCRALLQMKGGEAVQEQARSHFARFREALLDMAAWDHPQKKHASQMMDQGLVWQFLGGFADGPTFAGPQYWTAS